jgi:hypothetical protein
MTAAEEAAYNAAIKSAEQSVPTLNDYLQRLLTLDSVLIGGGFVVAKGDVLPHAFGVVVLITLLASLGMTLYGLMPTRGRVDVHGLNGLAAYQRFDRRAAEKKAFAAQWASFLLGLALAFGVIGLVAKGPTPQPTPVAPAAP